MSASKNMTAPSKTPAKKSKIKEVLRDMRISYQLYILVALPLIWLIIWRYIPMYGAQIAFRRFRAVDGIWGSQWVGFDQFIRFFNHHMFWTVIRNTLHISIYQLIAGFPFPVILALMLNNCLRARYKKTAQMVTYMPFFISVVVMVGIVIQFLSPHVGVVNHVIRAMGGTARDFMAEPSLFASIFVWSIIWQNTGFNTVVYLAALAGVDNPLHESAMIDGASRFKRMLYIDLRAIMPTMAVLLILNAGQLMNVGFERAFLMQNNLNRQASEVISIFVFRIGLGSPAADFSLASAIGLFNSVINMILILLVNHAAKKFGSRGLW